MSPNNFRNTIEGFDFRISAPSIFCTNGCRFCNVVPPRSYAYFKKDSDIEIGLDLFTAGIVFTRWEGVRLVKWAFREGYQYAIEDLTAILHSMLYIKNGGLLSDRVIYKNKSKFEIELVLDYFNIQNTLLKTFKGDARGFVDNWEEIIELPDGILDDYRRLKNGRDVKRLRMIRT